MPQNKLQRFADIKTFPNVFEFLFHERENDFKLKGRWNQEYFRNNHPIVLELGCGKGEYTVGLSERYPEKNFIGIDIKGNRIWRGAKTLLERKISNACFLRTEIEFIEKCFDPGEVSEIWITFPDPQPNKERKRLTHPIFLNRYKNILKPGGILHLKTDSQELHEFTLEMIHTPPEPPPPPRGWAPLKPRLLFATKDLYEYKRSLPEGDDLGGALAYKTHYEKLFSGEGKSITYLKLVLS